MNTHNRDLIGNDRQSRSDTPNSGSNYRNVLLVCTYTLHKKNVLNKTYYIY